MEGCIIMGISRNVVTVLAVCLVMLCIAPVLGQFAPPTGAMDTLSGMSTGAPGGAPAAPPGAAPGPPGNVAPGQPGQYFDPNMMMMMGMDPTMMMGMPGMPGAGTATPTATPTPKRYPALKGQRIYDAVSYRKNRANAIILDDVYRVEITEDETSMYSDEGTMGDAEPGDGVYAQILDESYKDWMGGQSNFYMQRVISMLQNAEKMDPLDFFGLQALTTEEFSIVPKQREKVSEQMAKIASVDKEQFSGWAQTFLKDYRENQEDRDSKFFPLYVPRYPEPPSVAPPPGPWKPYGHPDISGSGNQLSGANQFRPTGYPGMMPMQPAGFNPVGRAREAAGMMAPR